MNILVRSIGLAVSPSLHEYAERRAATALHRVLDPSARVSVQIIDENGPRGGVDKRCRIKVQGHGLYSYAEALDSDAYAAIDRACERIAAAVHRRGDRSKHVLRRARAATRAKIARWLRPAPVAV